MVTKKKAAKAKPMLCRHGSLRRSCETCDLADALDELYSANGGVPFDGVWVVRLQREAQGWRRLYEARKMREARTASAVWEAARAWKVRDQKKAQAQVPEPEASAEEFHEWVHNTFPEVKP